MLVRGGGYSALLEVRPLLESYIKARRKQVLAVIDVCEG